MLKAMDPQLQHLPSESTSTGLRITSDDHVIRLKWHRLRRSLRDPMFSVKVLHEGFRVGASMELDLRVRGDGGFVVLHDADLSGETTGRGPINSKTRDDLGSIRFRDEHRPLMFSEDLAGLLSSGHPDALLQFDMKDDFETVGPAGVRHLVAQFASKAQLLIISGDCLRLIAALAERLPELRRGIDPTNRLIAAFRSGGASRVEADLKAEIAGATEPDMVYLAWPLLLQLHKDGLDMVALCRAEGKQVDAWTFTPRDIGAGLNAKESEQLQAIVALKPDQITTDEAVALQQAWAALQAS